MVGSATGYSGDRFINRRAVGTFPTRRAAEEALQELKDSGFDMEQVSIVGRDSDGKTEVVDADGNKADEGAKVGAASGGAVGGLTGLLVGLGAIAIPGVGPIMLAGAAATALASTVAGGVIGAAAGGLLGALVGLGIPEEEAKAYEGYISAGEYLVLVDGTDAEIAHARNILSRRGIEHWSIYDLGDAAYTTNRPLGLASTATAAPVAPAPTAPVAPVAPATTGSAPTYSGTEDIKLYEERLRVETQREKTGEVVVGKQIETEVARVSVPVEKERVVIERFTPSGQLVDVVGTGAFQEGEVARVEVYEESADIRKEAFVREEVTIRKEVTQETVQAEETLRREELNIDTTGTPGVDSDIDPNTGRRI